MSDNQKILKVEAYTMSNELIISSDVFSYNNFLNQHDDERTIVIKGDIENPVMIDKKIKIILYYINGDRVQYNTHVDLCTYYQLNAILCGDKIVLEEKRRYYKLKVNIQAKIILAMNEDKEIIFEEEFPIQIKDINIGGVFIESENNDLKTGDYINIKMSLYGCEMVLLAKILRILNLENNLKGYGCCFVHIKMGCEEIIAKYINQVQRERMDQIKLNLKKR